VSIDGMLVSDTASSGLLIEVGGVTACMHCALLIIDSMPWPLTADPETP
jgi:hypothetical protein